MELFQKYWKDYNSDLFRQGKCDEFFIEDRVLVDILTDLRKPKKELPENITYNEIRCVLADKKMAEKLINKGS